MNEIIGIIPHKFRRRGFGVACTLLLRAGLNFLGLAVLLPVLALALDARSLDGGGQLARIYTALGFTSPRSFALTVCAAVVAVIVLKCLTNLWLARIERNYIYDLYRTLSRRLYVTYHDRGLPFVKSSNSAVLARNVNVVCLAFTAGVLKPAAAIAAEALLLALLFGALLWYAPVAAALAVAVFLPSVWIYYGLVRNRINRYGELENKAQREKARLVAETFRGYADIEINNAFPMMLRSFDRAMDQVIRTRLRETAIGMLPQAFTEIGLALGMALLVALSLGAEEGRTQLLFGVFAVAALRLMPSVRSIMAGWTSIKYNRYTIAVLRDATAGDEPSSASPDTLSGAAERAGKGPHTDAAAIPPSEYSAAESDKTARGRRTAPDKRTASGRQTAPYGQTAPAKQPCTAKSTKSVSAGGTSGACASEILSFEHEIAVRNLGFRFADDGHELFRGLTLSIRKGERIGIRGASGAGKTTLFNLLLGLYEPTGGEITIDGTPLTAANRRAWQNRIGYVSQNLFIADGSFAANVALGVPDDEIDRGRVAEALEAARLGEFVAGLSKGMDTHVGECGCRLSGGQRQRIGIARALYLLRRGDLGARQPHRGGDQPFGRRAGGARQGADAGGYRPPRKLARILHPNHHNRRIIMEYIIAGIRIAVPQEFTAGSFGTALAPFAAADEGPADLSVETRGEIRQADGYRELDEFDFADADADCRFGRDSEGYLLTMTPRDGCAAARFRKAFGAPLVTTDVTLRHNPALFRFGLWSMFNIAAVARQAVAIHSSVISLNGGAVLFLGESGTGKSTHTRLWREHIPGAELLNDDSPIVRIVQTADADPICGAVQNPANAPAAAAETPDASAATTGAPKPQAMVFGAPWSGKTPCYRNVCQPIRAIVRLSQAPHNRIRRLRAIEAIGALLPSCPPSFAHDETLEDAVCATVSAVVAQVPVYHLECLPDAAAAELACRTIFGGESANPRP